MEDAAKQNELSLLVAQTEQRQDEFNEITSDVEEESMDIGGISASERLHFLRDIRRVVKSSDIILQVLDARDPMGCRSPLVENMVKNSSKQLLHVLNKVDLVPTSAALGWLSYLRKTHPTVAFKSSVQSQRHNLSTGPSTGPLSGDSLIRLLKNYQHNLGYKRTIIVGVVGYPNVGKSSLINTLKRSKVAPTGNTPGLTRNVQEIMLDKKLILVDSPGVIFATAGHPSDLVLRNTVKIEKLTDVVPPVSRILELTPPITLCKLYGIPLYEGVTDFLHEVAQRKGKLLKGGTADAQAAGRIVLKDWVDGRIPFYSPPPSATQEVEKAVVSNEAVDDSVEFVSELSAEFKIDDDFLSQESTAIQDLAFAGDGRDYFERPQFLSSKSNELVEMMGEL
ncbi:hypothetical protein GEMRC1_010708 [Eukaryota sp. GEM-RC1]